jgi:hypothetical protein
MSGSSQASDVTNTTGGRTPSMKGTHSKKS